MLVLLDENLPHGLRLLITGHDVRTVAYQGWASLTNGALLAAAEEAGFEVFLTADQNLPDQQSMKGRDLAVVVLSTSELSVLARRIEDVIEAMNVCRRGAFSYVAFGVAPRF